MQRIVTLEAVSAQHIRLKTDVTAVAVHNIIKL